MLAFRLVEEAFTKGITVIAAIVTLVVVFKTVQGIIFLYKNRGRY